MRGLASSVDSARMHKPDGPARGHSYALGLRGLTTRPRPHPPPLHDADSPLTKPHDRRRSPLYPPINIDLPALYLRLACPHAPSSRKGPSPAPRPPQPVRARRAQRSISPTDAAWASPRGVDHGERAGGDLRDPSAAGLRG